MAAKQCPLCGKTFFGNPFSKRRFCSKRCRTKWHTYRWQYEKFQKDSAYKQNSLKRLLAWKEKKKQERLQQKEGGEKQVIAEAFWV